MDEENFGQSIIRQVTAVNTRLYPSTCAPLSCDDVYTNRSWTNRQSSPSGHLMQPHRSILKDRDINNITAQPPPLGGSSKRKSPVQSLASPTKRTKITHADEINEDEPPLGQDDYSNQWSFAFADKAITMGSKADSRREGSDKSSISKASKRYAPAYLGPRGVRVCQDVDRDELKVFRQYLGDPSAETLKNKLGRMYLDKEDEVSIETLVEFAEDYGTRQENESQWSIEVYLPGFLGGRQNPPRYIKNGMIERRSQEFILGQRVDAGADATRPVAGPPPIIHDAEHSVTVVEDPPENDKVPGKKGYYLDWMFAVKHPALSANVKQMPAIRTNSQRKLLPSYCVAEAKADQKDSLAAVNYSAWVLSCLLHERLRFRAIFSNEKIEFAESDSIYAILPTGPHVHIYKMHVRVPKEKEKPSEFDPQGSHVRCELKLLSELALDNEKDCKTLFMWMNHIHFFGMTAHKAGVVRDIELFEQSNQNSRRSLVDVSDAIFRYRSESESCSVTILPHLASSTGSVVSRLTPETISTENEFQNLNFEKPPIREVKAVPYRRETRASKSMRTITEGTNV